MLDKVEKELNSRPRSCLKFDSPSEILREVKKGHQFALTTCIHQI